MHSALETFAGLLDRSVAEIAASAADARTIDLARISRLADIWDNNTFPLVSAACAPRSARAGLAGAGLLWMADLGAARRELMTSLNPDLDSMLPAARPAPAAYRDYQGRVRPGSVPVTAETAVCLEADYDLPSANVRSLTAWPTHAGQCASLTLAAPRRFTPSTGRVTQDGTLEPWPPALLASTFTDVGELAFDADIRTGAAITSAAGISLAIGRSGHVLAASAIMHPDDPCWHESAAGRAADTVTPHEREALPAPVPTSDLSGQERAAVKALHYLMLRIRLVGYHPSLASAIPVRELCEAANGAGTAILRAGDRHGSPRRTAFADLEQQWRRVPRDAAPVPVPAAPARLRYVRYSEPHRHYGSDRPGQATLVAATLDPDRMAPWRLASEEITDPTQFRISCAAFDGVCDIYRSRGQLALGGGLVIQQER